MHKYLLLLLATVLLMPAFATEGPTAGDEKTTLDSNDKNLKILSWNIYMLPRFVVRKGKKERAHAIVEELKKSDYDIIVFQEAFLPAARAIIQKGLDSLYPNNYGPANSTPNILTNSGVWVLSKQPLTVINTIRFNDCKGNDCYARKGAMLLQGEWNGKKFQLLGTHLQADGYQDIRYRQMDQIYTQLLSPYKQDSVPQVICGDMNTEQQMKNYYCSMLECLDANNGEIEGLQKESYDGSNNDIAEWVGGKRKMTLDYILLRNNGSRVKAIKRTISVLKKGKKHLSDHYGVVCELKF